MNGCKFVFGEKRQPRDWAHPTPVASGRFAGLEIQERADAEAGRRHRRAPRRLDPTTLLRQDMLDAMDWARGQGFTEAEARFAAPMALLLRRVLGKGNVKASAVREQCEKKYPHVFGGVA